MSDVQKGAEREIGTQKIPTFTEISILREKLEGLCPEICADLSPLSLLKNWNGQHQEEDVHSFTVMKDILTYLRSVHAHVEQTLCELRRAGYGEKEIGEARVEAETLHTALQQYDDRKRRLTRQLRDGSISAVNASTFVQYLSTEDGAQRQKRDELRQLETWLREADALRRELLSDAVGNRKMADVLSEHMRKISTQHQEQGEMETKNGTNVRHREKRVRSWEKRKERRNAQNGTKLELSSVVEEGPCLLYNVSDDTIAAMERAARLACPRPLGTLLRVSLIENDAKFQERYCDYNVLEGDYLFRFEEGTLVLHPGHKAIVMVRERHRKMVPEDVERHVQEILSLPTTENSPAASPSEVLPSHDQ